MTLNGREFSKENAPQKPFLAQMTDSGKETSDI
jgi:hypothetical protein